MSNIIAFPQTEQQLNDELLSPKSDVFYGLPGRIVETIDQHTEAHPMAVLSNVMVMFGNVTGGNPHFLVEHTKHHTNLNVGQVGRTSKARKGTGNSTPKKMYESIDRDWQKKHITSGLSSGEGLIYSVRDAQAGSGDPGVTDKRLMVIEEEFSQALKTMSRDGNILSQTLRDAWDGKDLHPLTKTSPIAATSPHISIIGHITSIELQRYLKEVEMANGLANRFIWVHVHRTKLIPSPKGVPPETLEPLVNELRAAVTFAQSAGEMTRNPAAEELWAAKYAELSEGKPGLSGGITSRAEAQVLRLSMIYALMDQSAVIRPEHLNAALAFWDYSDRSVSLIFRDQLGDPNVDRVWDYLTTLGKLGRAMIHNILRRNASKQEVDRICEVLVALQWAEWTTLNGHDVLVPKKRK